MKTIVQRESEEDGGPLTRAGTLADLTASAFLERLATGELRVVDYVEACLKQIEALEPRVHAWQTLDPEAVRLRARRLDSELASGRPRGRLEGVPVGVKDIFNTYDLPTGMGSSILEGYTPGNDARVVSNIRLESGIIAGKTVTAEFAVHHPGPTRNPHDLSRTPGTSSSGSAAAVAACMVPVALASQTGGSVIRPASYCGIAGFKPSFGLIPRTAMLKTTDTLDSVGFLARSVADLELLFEVTRVRGHNYPISDARLADPERQQVRGRPYRLGVVTGPKSDYESDAARAALASLLERMKSSGEMELREFVLPPPFDEAHEVHEHIYRRALAYYFTTEWTYAREKFSPKLREMISGGLEISPDEYAKGLERQRALARELDALFRAREIDVLIGLATADEAPAGLEIADLPDHCLVWTMAGCPVVSLPLLAGTTGLPLGVQLVARRYSDYLLLDFAGALERLEAKSR